VTELTAAARLRLHALHCVARLALRFRLPLKAKGMVDGIARAFPPLDGVDEARAAVRTLFPKGTCLSRAVTIAAALPGAEVVIGVNVWTAARLAAHAWLEVSHVRIDTNPSSQEFPDELARLPPVPSIPRPHRPRLSYCVPSFRRKS